MNSEQFKALPLIDLGGIWHMSYFVGMVLTVVLWAFVMDRLLPWSWKALWTWLVVWCLFLLEYPRAHFGPYTHSFQATAGQVLAELIFIPFAAFTASCAIECLIPFLAGFAVTCVWVGLPGLMHAPSFNMALACMCTPFVPWWLVVVTAVTALTHHGSTALLILAVQLIVGVAHGRYGKRLLVCAIPVMTVSAWLLQNQPRLNSGERMQKWTEYAAFWAVNWRTIVFGSGPGSFIWYSVMTTQTQTGYYLQIHNDYGEVIWAAGLIGGLLAIWVMVDTVKRAWDKPLEVKQGLAGCFACMLTYGPLEYYPTALLTAWIFVRVLIIEDVDLKLPGFVWSVERDDG